MGEQGQGAGAGRDGRRRVAILGGGAAGLAAAYELTRTPQLREAFDVTVHQHGWRLGGKGASGRDPARHQRIEEHGLHVWFGFYRNAFGLLDACYRELDREGRARRFATVAEAFTPCEQLSLAAPAAGGGWRSRSFDLPAEGAPPVARELRDAAKTGTAHPLLWFVPYLLGLVERAARELLGGEPAVAAEPRVARARAELELACADGQRLAAATPPPADGRPPGRLGALAGGPLGWLTERSPLAGLLRRLGLGGRATAPVGELLEIARASRRVARELASASREATVDEGTLRFVAQLADFAAALLALIAVRVLPRVGSDPAPFDHLNALELRDALRGARRDGGPLDCPADLRRDLDRLRRLGLLAEEETLGASFVRVLYDLAFAYRDGDPARPDVGAGVALENLVNIGFGHDGTLMHKMRAGMGDVVFAPLYRLLGATPPGETRPRARFEFFSAVERVEAPRGRVEAVTVRRQAGLADPAAGYRPLVEVNGLPCWPSAPLARQLAPASRAAFAALRDRRGGDHPAMAFERDTDPLGDFTDTEARRLSVGADFDDVVLAIPVGAHRELAGGAGGIADAAFADMVAGAGTVATNAFQLWLVGSLAELGPPAGVDPERASIAGGYRKPFDTYCDMTHLIGEERWPRRRLPGRPGPPGSIAYFCGPMHDPPGDWREAEREAGRRALAFVEELAAEGEGRPFWGRMFGPEQLVAGPLRRGWEARFREQYWRANSTGWERYASSFAGTLERRLRADGSRPDGGAGMAVDNLALAGDWTYTAVNAGSVEAAVASGIEAARTLIRRANAAGGAALPEPEIDVPPWRGPA